jgi:aminopeptidase N
MKKNQIAALLSCILMILGLLNPLMAQETKPLNTYRETPAKINDLVHTKLDVRFDYKKHYLYGKEWITLIPHFIQPTL